MECKQWCYSKAGVDIPTCSYSGLLAHHVVPNACKVCCSVGSLLSAHVSTCQLMAEALGLCSHLRAIPSRGTPDSAVQSPARAQLLGRIHPAGLPSLALALQARQLPPMSPKLALQLLVRRQRLGRLARMGLQLLGRRQRLGRLAKMGQPLPGRRQPLGRLARMGQPHPGRPQRLGSPTATGRQRQGRALRLDRLARTGQPLPARPQQMGSRARMAPTRLL